MFSASSFSSLSDGVVYDELVVEEGKRGEGVAPSRLEKEGVLSTLPAQDIIRRLPDSGEGDVYINDSHFHVLYLFIWNPSFLNKKQTVSKA